MIQFPLNHQTVSLTILCQPVLSHAGRQALRGTADELVPAWVSGAQRPAADSDATSDLPAAGQVSPKISRSAARYVTAQ